MPNCVLKCWLNSSSNNVIWDLAFCPAATRAENAVKTKTKNIYRTDQKKPETVCCFCVFIMADKAAQIFQKQNHKAIKSYQPVSSSSNSSSGNRANNNKNANHSWWLKQSQSLQKLSKETAKIVKPGSGLKKVHFIEFLFRSAKHLAQTMYIRQELLQAQRWLNVHAHSELNKRRSVTQIYLSAKSGYNAFVKMHSTGKVYSLCF